MNFGSIFDTFNLLTHPKSARTSILLEMQSGKRTFDPAVLRDYAQKGFKDPFLDMPLVNREICQMAIERGVTDVAIAMIDQGKVNLNNPIRVDLEGEIRSKGWFVFNRQLTDGELMLKQAVDSGNTEVIRKLHEKKVPADIETVESPHRSVFVLRDLWKTGDIKQMRNVLSVMKELYPDAAARHAGYERAETTTNRATVKSVVTAPLYT